MKSKILSYLTITTTVFLLQSCVSNYNNYVASQPMLHKIDAKLKVPTGKIALTNKKKISPSRQINMALAALEKNDIKSEIEKTILHESKIDALLVEAESYLGTPYRFGGMSRRGIDCSAFVLSVFGESMGVELPRVAASQALEGDRVESGDLQKGDLVFFSHRGGGRISHVGIVYEVEEDGEVKFIHASTSKGVIISSLSDRYWGPRYQFAKRILDKDYTTDPMILANNNG